MAIKSFILIFGVLLLFSACAEKKALSNTNQEESRDIYRGKFRWPILNYIYEQSDLVINGEIIKKKKLSGLVRFSATTSVWIIEIKINRVFKNQNSKKLKKGDSIKTYVTSGMLEDFPTADTSGNPKIELALPNLDRFNNQSICFFKKRTAESVRYLAHRFLDDKNLPWDYDWVDVFFPYYTPLDIHSQDSIHVGWGNVSISELAPESHEHRYLRDLLGFPLYPEWLKPYDSNWTIFAPWYRWTPAAKHNKLKK